MSSNPSVGTALVLGGNSDIALATVRRLTRDRLDAVVLAVRDPSVVEARLAGEPLGARSVTVVPWDALDSGGHDALLERARDVLGHIDLVLCAVGALGHHAGLPLDPPAADHLMQANFAGPASALLAAAHSLVTQGSGQIVAISSVAGARARKSNFVYGSAKAGLDSFSQGLADSLIGTGVSVHIIRPGFVRSKMTAGLDPAPFSTTPEVVAEAIARAVHDPAPGREGSGANIVWVPRKLGPMMALLRVAPGSVWRHVAGDR